MLVPLSAVTYNQTKSSRKFSEEILLKMFSPEIRTETSLSEHDSAVSKLFSKLLRVRTVRFNSIALRFSKKGL